ncbi:MAG: hypothetical protein P8L68_04780 [Paracoccaceae bacterium]|nr:hypothetical protein [Paracoccaceae bacterium]
MNDQLKEIGQAVILPKSILRAFRNSSSSLVGWLRTIEIDGGMRRRYPFSGDPVLMTAPIAHGGETMPPAKKAFANSIRPPQGAKTRPIFLAANQPLISASFSVGAPQAARCTA